MTTGLPGLVEAYCDHLAVERGVSGHTVAAYRRDLHRYVEHLTAAGLTDPAAVTSAMISDYAMGLREGVRDPEGAGWIRRPLGPASVARAVVAVRSLHRFAQAEGLVDDDPAAAVQPPKPPRRLPKALGLDQVQAMLDVPATDTVLGLRDRALLELLYGTGVRISEAVALDVDEVSRLVELDRDAPTPGLRVLGKGRKERIVPLGSYARAALDAYLVRARPELARQGSGNPALFLNARGGRLSRQSAWTILRAVAERAGITVDVSPHTLRHCFATHLLDGGADVRVVQELLGHASVTTTQIYTLVTVDHLREVYLTSHPRAY
ncbi:MAG TPA: site-specific tyrosine recombinase XerD [Propionibacteriaceae bacterium]|jgi:integrase/recombinase XerD|nr:site-specific tyrosine recombinase XerD [Propionibacteriaceae bacterium]